MDAVTQRPLSRGRLALISIGVSSTLASAKFFASRTTGSVALLGASLDAVMDIGVTVLAYGAVHWTRRFKERRIGTDVPPIEQYIALAHTSVMIGIGGFIVFQSSRQLVTHEMTMRMEETPTAIATIAVAFILEVWRAGLVASAARTSGSPVLAAAALGFRMDLMTTTVAMIGLLTVGTGWQIADPIAALIIGCVTLFAAARLLRDTLRTLASLRLTR